MRRVKQSEFVKVSIENKVFSPTIKLNPHWMNVSEFHMLELCINK